MNKKLILVLAAAAIGVINGLVFKGFEFLAQNVTSYLWNDVFGSDTTRWLVLPLAIGLGVLFSFVLRLLRQPRWQKPQVDLLADSPKSKVKTTLANWGGILAAGAMSMWAGASLGPEAPLTESSKAIGELTADKLRLNKAAPILVLSSVGALMVAFLGSLLMILLPILILYKKSKKFPLAALVPIVVAGLTAYSTLWVVDHHDMGFGSIPTYEHLYRSDYIAVVIVGFIVALGAFTLKWLILRFAVVTKRLDKKLRWYASAALFGAVVGILYLLGGQSVEFTGSAGSHMLFVNRTSYGTWALLGLAVVKFMVTAWSKAGGYRGGLVFPSIYAGVALGLMVGAAVSPLEGSGALIGAIAGIFAAVLGSAPVALLFLVALLPVKLTGLAILGTLAAAVSTRYLGKYLPAQN